MQSLFRVAPQVGIPPNPFILSGVDDDEDWMEDPENWDRPWDDEDEDEEEEEDDWAGDDEEDDYDDFDDEEE